MTSNDRRGRPLEKYSSRRPAPVRPRLDRESGQPGRRTTVQEIPFERSDRVDSVRARMPAQSARVDLPDQNKLENFTKYVPRQRLSRFLAQYELFKLQQHIKGSIVECGVHRGATLLAWAKLSAALEPYAIHRRVFGFDTFVGFPSLHEKDQRGEFTPQKKEHGFDPGYDVYGELGILIDEYDSNRFLNQYRKVFLIKGDARQTIPEFVGRNSYLLVSLLFLDFDLYEPTKVALDHFLPRMGKGALLVFDELNNAHWPGATQALLETGHLHQYKINRFTMDPNLAYIVL